MWKLCLASLCVLGSAAFARAQSSENPWPSFRDPAPGPAHAIGDYAAGCLQGGRALPLQGIGYQVMRPSRRRYYGHPELIDFVRTLGKGVRRQQLGVVLVGDLSQPRGGRAASGHASHQTGLDADVWFWHPPRAEKVLLPMPMREQLVAESVVDAKARVIRAPWKKPVTKMLRLAADDPRVERVFVNPAIKRELCEGPSGQRAWLRKIRPWHGHDDHFHVRLACSAADPECQSQAPLPPGDGCDKLAFWFERAVRPARKRAQKSYQHVVTRGRGWPERCNALLQPPAQRARLAAGSTDPSARLAADSKDAPAGQTTLLERTAQPPAAGGGRIPKAIVAAPAPPSPAPARARVLAGVASDAKSPGRAARPQPTETPAEVPAAESGPPAPPFGTVPGRLPTNPYPERTAQVEDGAAMPGAPAAAAPQAAPVAGQVAPQAPKRRAAGLAVPGRSAPARARPTGSLPGSLAATPSER